MRPWRWIVPTILALGSCAGGDPNTAPGPPPPKPKAEKGVVRLDHLRIDLAKRQIVLETEVCLRSGPLELLVCKSDTKDYESILRTKARPSDLHAALLMLKLRPGKPAEMAAVGEQEKPRLLPPRGPELKIRLRWKDRQGKQHDVDAAEWLAGPQGKRANAPKRWVFVGSGVLPDGAYWADRSGDVISVANFASAVIDVPFESSASNDLLEFVANTAAIPPEKTPVEVVITPFPGAENAPHVRALLEIDRLGRMRLDGTPIPLDKLAEWAATFIERHPKGRVVIRTAVHALASDLELARRELDFGGVEEFDEERLLPADRLLPRTAEQARAALAEYRKGFANPEWTVPDPVRSAETTLEQIEVQLQELKRRELLLKEYRQHLRQALKDYRASTQPATSPAKQPAARE